MQDLDGNGEIGFGEVSGLFLVHDIKLILHAQFKALWDYVKVGHHSHKFSVSFNSSIAAMARDVRVL